MHVPHVDSIKFQTEEEMDVIQHQDQLVLAFSITLLVVTNALIAQLDKFQITKEDNATQHQLVLDQAKSEEHHKIASDAKLAQPHLYQMLIELDVWDVSQCAHVLRNTQLTDITASSAQLDTFKMIETINNANKEFAHHPQTTSLETETPATDVTYAQAATNPTATETAVIESSQSVGAMRSMTPLDTSVSHAQHTKLLLTEIQDVILDSAQA